METITSHIWIHSPKHTLCYLSLFLLCVFVCRFLLFPLRVLVYYTMIPKNRNTELKLFSWFMYWLYSIVTTKVTVISSEENDKLSNINLLQNYFIDYTLREHTSQEITQIIPEKKFFSKNDIYEMFPIAANGDNRENRDHKKDDVVTDPFIGEFYPDNEFSDVDFNDDDDDDGNDDQHHTYLIGHDEIMTRVQMQEFKDEIHAQSLVLKEGLEEVMRKDLRINVASITQDIKKEFNMFKKTLAQDINGLKDDLFIFKSDIHTVKVGTLQINDDFNMLKEELNNSPSTAMKLESEELVNIHDGLNILKESVNTVKEGSRQLEIIYDDLIMLKESWTSFKQDTKYYHDDDDDDDNYNNNNNNLRNEDFNVVKEVMTIVTRGTQQLDNYIQEEFTTVRNEITALKLGTKQMNEDLSTLKDDVSMMKKGTETMYQELNELRQEISSVKQGMSEILHLLKSYNQDNNNNGSMTSFFF